MSSVEEEISKQDLYRVHLKSRGEIERLEWLDKEECEMLENIKQGWGRHFRQVVFGVKIRDAMEVVDNYNALFAAMDELRTFYLYKGLKKPVKVVVRYMRSGVPTADLRKMDQKEKNLFVKNVLACEGRREYDPERDFPLKIQCFQLQKDRGLAMVSFYGNARLSMSVRGMIFKIFGNTVFSDRYSMDINKRQLENITDKLIQKSEAYWNMLAPFGDELKLPGEIPGTHTVWDKKNVIYKAVDGNVYEKLKSYCAAQKISERAALLSVWGEMIGSFNGVEEPVVCLVAHGENMRVFPVRIDLKLDVKRRGIVVSDQLDKLEKNSSCSRQFLEGLLGKRADEFFHAAFSFVQFDSGSSFPDVEKIFMVIDGGQDEMERAGIQICNHLMGEEFGIGYTYQTDKYQEVTVERIHQFFLNYLSGFISGSGKKFDKERYILDTDTDEEKRRKLEIAQYALYMKNSGLFPGSTTEEFMSMAEKATLRSYISSDIVIEQGQALVETGILVEGHLEEYVMGMDGVLRSIRLISPGGIIGVEGILEKNKAHFSYGGVGENVKVLWFDRDVLISFLSGNLDNWREFLGYAVDDSVRVKRLWTME